MNIAAPVNSNQYLLSFYKDYMARYEDMGRVTASMYDRHADAFKHCNVLSGALNLYYRSKYVKEDALRVIRNAMFSALEADGYNRKTGLDTENVDRENRLFSKERVEWVKAQIARLS